MDIGIFYLIYAIISFTVAGIAYMVKQKSGVYTALILIGYSLLNIAFIFILDIIPDSNSDIVIYVITVIFSIACLIAFFLDEYKGTVIIIAVVGYVISALATATTTSGNTSGWLILFPPILTILIGVFSYRFSGLFSISMIVASVGMIIWIAIDSDVFIQSASVILLIISAAVSIRVQKKKKDTIPIPEIKEECKVYCDESKTECCDV